MSSDQKPTWADLAKPLWVGAVAWQLLHDFSKKWYLSYDFLQKRNRELKKVLFIKNKKLLELSVNTL
jgi:hypothetical protein